MLRPDLRLDIPTITVKPPTRATTTAPGQAAPPAPVSKQYNGPHIAEIKVIGKGVKAHYKLGTRGGRAVDSRANAIPAEYKRKAAAMDAVLGVEDGEGPCLRRLSELPLVPLCWGSYGEGSSGVHDLVTLLAACRVRTLALRGDPPSTQQMGLEVTAIRRRLSTAAVRAVNTTLLARMSQVGEGSGIASRRREWQRREEQQMEHSREADWILHTTGRAIVRRGRIWGK